MAQASVENAKTIVKRHAVYEDSGNKRSRVESSALDVDSDLTERLTMRAVVYDIQSLDMRKLPVHFFPMHLVHALVNFAEEVNPSKWRWLFSQAERSETKEVFGNLKKKYCDITNDALKVSKEQVRTIQDPDQEVTITSDWQKSRLRSLRKFLTYDTSHKDRDFALIVCAFLVKLFDVKRNSRGAPPTKNERERILGEQMVSRYSSLKEATVVSRIWGKKLSMPESLHQSFPFAHQELCEGAAEYLSREGYKTPTHEVEDDDVVLELPEYDHRAATRFEVFTSTQKQLECSRSELERLERDQARTKAALEEINSIVESKRAEVELLERKNLQETQDRNWGMWSRTLINDDTNYDSEASDIYYSVHCLRMYQEKTHKASLMDCVKQLLPPDIVQNLKVKVRPLSQGVLPEDDLDADSENAEVATDILTNITTGPIAAGPPPESNAIGNNSCPGPALTQNCDQGGSDHRTDDPVASNSTTQTVSEPTKQPSVSGVMTLPQQSASGTVDAEDIEEMTADEIGLYNANPAHRPCGENDDELSECLDAANSL